MKEALIVVDYTNDFVASDGKLTCGEPGQNIEERLAAVLLDFHQNEKDIFFAVDVHEENDLYHPETSLFPPHNIRGTNGRQQYGRVQSFIDIFGEEWPNHLHWLDKTRYSAFAGTPLELKLRERGVTDLHLVGVCTDICILHTAIDGYNRGFGLVIHKDAVQSFNAKGHAWALDHFQHCLGASVVSGM
ncbi:nicotinamidase-related amidase [Geomicrobium halophilum]|uniref:Nicotinamidase-related amidase n=1 Tax=Geomicrobium halophilum TaxID=549000 RepID=A0A841PHN4_9BACL|nr:isochorismatase family cysteine hydrolase [Geomicrobium halophilum]MBB6448397.1 nicotinamidase-related amidase [Geomicrobium halophilum]